MAARSIIASTSKEFHRTRLLSNVSGSLSHAPDISVWLSITRAGRHLPGTARTGAFSFPSRLVGETSKQLLKRLEQALPVSCSFGVQAVALQGFLNLLVMDNFQADVRKRIHTPLPSCASCQHNNRSYGPDCLHHGAPLLQGRSPAAPSPGASLTSSESRVRPRRMSCKSTPWSAA